MTIPPPPDQPHPAGPQASPGAPIPPGQPPRKKKSRRWLLLVAALLGLALIGGGCFAIRALEEAAPGPGDCIAFRAPHDKTNIDQRPVPYKIDCGSPEAEYKMLSSSRTNHSCAPGNRMYQWRKVKNGQLGEPTQTWCLQPLPGGPNRAPAR